MGNPMITTPYKQQGIATVLIVLLVGVALSASTLGVIYTLKGTQDNQVTAHAKSNAEAAAWTLIQAASKYVEGKASDQAALDTYIASLPDEIEFTNQLPGYSGSVVTITNKTSITANTALFAITASVNDQNSQSTARVTTLLEVTPGQAAQPCPPSEVNLIRGPLTANQLDIYMSSENASLTVEGDIGSVDDQVSLHGLKSLRSTGKISLKGTGDAPLDLLHANDDISITSVAAVDEILSGRTVTYASNQFANKILAAGNIIWRGSEGSGSLQAGVIYEGIGPNGEDLTLNQVSELASVRDNDDPNGLLTSLGIVEFEKDDPKIHQTVKMRGAFDMDFTSLRINHASTQNTLTISTYANGLETAAADDMIICQTNNATQAVYSGGTVTGPVTTDGTNSSDAKCNFTQLTENDLATTQAQTSMETFEPVEIATNFLADADEYDANYSFSREGTDTIIDVLNVNGLVSGKYRLGANNNLYTYEGNTNTNFNICGGHTGACFTFKETRILTDDEYRPKFNGTDITVNELRTQTEDKNNTIEVHPEDGTWVFEFVNKIAPGVYYFDRDLRIKGSNDSIYINTFLSAGDIQTLNPITIVALNGAPEAALCRNESITSPITYAQVVQEAAEGEEPVPLGVEPIITTVANSTNYPLQDGKYPFPTNFCGTNSQGQVTKLYNNTAREQGDVVDGAKLPLVGQFAVMAGQENEAGDIDEYQGGNIYGQSSMTFIGRVLAGNTLQFVDGTNTNIYGSISSEARADGVANANNNLGRTVKLHPKFLDTLSGGQSQPCQETSANGASSIVKWSGYF